MPVASRVEERVIVVNTLTGKADGILDGAIIDGAGSEQFERQGIASIVDAEEAWVAFYLPLTYTQACVGERNLGL